MNILEVRHSTYRDLSHFQIYDRAAKAQQIDTLLLFEFSNVENSQ